MASAAVWLLFFLSGACGLIYEVLWSRHLGLILGNTTYSLAAVLSAFMAGLALGSYLAGRWLERRLARGPVNLLKVYGLIEIGIGVYCALLPLLFDAAAPLYAGLYGETGGAALAPSRFALSFLLLLLPTTGMGATLPVLSQLMTRSPMGMSRSAGTLYAVNTFGAVVGAAGAGFLLLPELGREGTNLVAVVGNLVLGGAAMLAGRLQGAPADSEATEPVAAQETAPAGEAPPIPEPTIRLAILVFGITGFAAMATQIGWTRALSLSIGSSTYAFSLIVAVFILGLAVGGAWGSRVAPRLQDPIGALAQVLLLIGVLSMAVVALLGMGPIFFFWLIAVGSQWGFGVLMLVEALGVAALLFFPTFLMGATMPLTLQAVQSRARTSGGVGKTVGTLYAVNTTGSILGSLAGGLVLMPLIQIQSTLQAGAWLYALPGIALFLRRRDRSGRRPAVLAALLLLATLALTFAPRWNPLRMSSGAYLMRTSPETLQAAREGRFLEAFPTGFGDEKLYYKEGASASVAVLKTSTGMLTMTVGGKPDASGGKDSADMSTQVGLTLVPELLHKTGPKEVLVIGMGSGISAGAALAPPGVERVDIVEISPEVMEAAWFFRAWSGLKYASEEHPSALAEPRVQVLINDGRNHLRLTSRRYDVIASEPSNPWIAGIGNLFTREAFTLCRERLKPGGIFSQWLHRYGMSEREFKSVMATFAEVFPHGQLWCVYPGSDYLLIGSEQPLEQDYAALAARMRPERVHALLASVNFHRIEEFMACFMADGARLKQLCAGAEIHTDDNMLLEFAAPRTLLSGGAQFPLMPWRVWPERTLRLDGVGEDEARDLRARLDRSAVARSLLDRLNDRTGAPKDLLDASLVLSPDLYWSRHSLRQQTAAHADAAPWTPAQPDEAVRAAEARPAGDPTRAEARAEALEARALWRCRQGLLDEAERDRQAAAAAKPGRAETALLHARILSARGDVDGCSEAAKQAEALGSPGIENAELVADAFLKARRAADALAFVDRFVEQPALRNNPEAARLWAVRAEALVALNGIDQAIQAIQTAVRMKVREPRAQRARVAAALAVENAAGLAESARAVDAFRAFMDPRNPADYLAWGGFEARIAKQFQESGRSEEATEHLRRMRGAGHAATAIAPGCPAGWTMLAQACRLLGDEEGARAAERKARDLEAAARP
ncbi:MAG: fused MFS/spermidine synthase [Planctomycetota bacterium]|nr:fused MFS/spermidine synthase [Planctomycetota bacterium]